LVAIGVVVVTAVVPVDDDSLFVNGEVSEVEEEAVLIVEVVAEEELACVL